MKELVQQYPGDERAHNALGNQLFFARAEYDPAIAEYKKAVEINPEYSPAYNSMGYAARAAGRLDEAERTDRPRPTGRARVLRHPRDERRQCLRLRLLRVRLRLSGCALSGFGT